MLIFLIKFGRRNAFIMFWLYLLDIYWSMPLAALVCDTLYNNYLWPILNILSLLSCFKMKIDTSLTIPQPSEALSQAGLQFDVATEEDFDEIMAMSQDIYGGLDYLPTRYTSWLQETNRTVIVARKEGKVVRLTYSMCVFTIIDN